MAYSQIQQFYMNHDQFKLMTGLCKRTHLTIDQLAELRWKDVTGRTFRNAKVERELWNRLYRIQYKAAHSTIPFEYVFYKEIPNRKNPQGLRFTPDEIWQLCGKPRCKKPKKCPKRVLTLPRLRFTIELRNKSTLQA